MFDPILAHNGVTHWYDYVLWVGPLAVVVGFMLRERWRMRQDDGASADRETPPRNSKR